MKATYNMVCGRLDKADIPCQMVGKQGLYSHELRAENSIDHGQDISNDPVDINLRNTNDVRL